MLSTEKKEYFCLKAPKLNSFVCCVFFFRDKGLIFYSSSLLFILRSSLCISLFLVCLPKKYISFLFHFILFVHTKMLLHYVYIIHIFCRFFFSIFILPFYYYYTYFWIKPPSNDSNSLFHVSSVFSKWGI